MRRDVGRLARLRPARTPAGWAANAARRALRRGSHGVIPGTIQLTPDGTPIVLLADAGTTGGYPVIAVVVSVDLDIVGQARPGGTLRFQAVDLASARRALVELRRTLAG